MVSKKSETEIAPVATGGAMTTYDYGAAAGAGFSSDPSHYLVPRIEVLQPMSKALVEGNTGYIPGSRPGMFVNTVSREVFDGKDPAGLLFVPCETQHVYLDFVPLKSGGGFRGQYAPSDPYVLDAIRKAGRAFGAIPHAARTPEGDEEPRELIETFVLLGMVLDAPDAERAREFVAINFKSTQIKKYKALQYRLHAMNVAGKTPPLFAHRLRLVTVPERNAKGNWFGIEAKPAVGDSFAASLLDPKAPLFDEGWKWSERVRAGAATVAQDDANSAPDEEDGGGHF